MFYNNYDQVSGEDRWGMVGKVGDDFREDRQLNVPCYQCHQTPLVIAECNWKDTNPDHSQCYQIMVVCQNCGAVDEFEVNAGQEQKQSRLKHAKVVPTIDNLI